MEPRKNWTEEKEQPKKNRTIKTKTHYPIKHCIMKVGSIVECVNNEGLTHAIPPKLNQPYTVRWILPPDNFGDPNSHKYGVYLEEIVNDKHPRGPELGYLMERFRELLPPMNIQDALDSCEPVLIELNK